MAPQSSRGSVKISITIAPRVNVAALEHALNDVGSRGGWGTEPSCVIGGASEAPYFLTFVLARTAQSEPSDRPGTEGVIRVGAGTYSTVVPSETAGAGCQWERGATCTGLSEGTSVTTARTADPAMWPDSFAGPVTLLITPQ